VEDTRPVMATSDKVIDYFTRRAPDYDASSHWCMDEALVERLRGLLQPRPTDVLLDVACGTGLIARALRPYVARVVGVDVTPEMLARGRPHLDEALLADAERLPLEAGRCDLVTCRQGIQFLDAARATAEMVRVARPGGKVCLIHLCAYGDEDRDEFFEILRLRNPARRNFFLREDLVRLLREVGCQRVELHEHISPEDVGTWSGKAAIGDDDVGQIREKYLRASDPFKRLHRLEVDASGRIRDHMLFGIAIGIA
jgi:SAM-dependent methyltransferase